MVKIISILIFQFFLFACASSHTGSNSLLERIPAAAGKVYFRVIPATPFIKVLGPDSMDVFFSTPETYADPKDKGVGIGLMQIFEDADVTLVAGDLADGKYIMFVGGMWGTPSKGSSAQFTVKNGRVQNLRMRPSGEFVIIAE